MYVTQSIHNKTGVGVVLIDSCMARQGSKQTRKGRSLEGTKGALDPGPLLSNEGLQAGRQSLGLGP
jgi:hypothetical protein